MNIWIGLGFGLLGMLVIAVMAYQLVKQLIDEEGKRRASKHALADRNAIMPLRLQAYERAVLFLDRMNPGELVLRVHKSHMDARTLHMELLTTIKEEYGHNVSQQLYMSDSAWTTVKQAAEETKRLMNVAFERTPKNATGTDYSRQVFEVLAQLPHTPSQAAIQVLRKEFQGLFA
jgi:hypothetical protein